MGGGRRSVRRPLGVSGSAAAQRRSAGAGNPIDAFVQARLAREVCSLRPRPTAAR